VLDSSGQGIQPIESERQVGEEEKVSGQRLSELLAELKEVTGRERGLERIIQTSDENQRDQATVSKWRDLIQQRKDLRERVKKVENEMRSQGWLISKDGKGGFKVELAISKAGNKIIRVADAYGEMPVQKGQSFSANKNEARNIPESVRDMILNSFVYGGDNVAKQLYTDIPEGKSGAVDTGWIEEKTPQEPEPGETEEIEEEKETAA